MPATRRPPSDGALSAIGLGCSRIGSFNNPTPIAETRRLLAAAFDLGVTLFDTADIYGQGDSERELGRFLAGRRRDEAFVVTKMGKRFSLKMRVLRPFKPILKPFLSGTGGSRVSARRGDNLAADFSAARIAPAVEASLRRLRAEALDGLLLHSPPPAAAADPAVWEALDTLRQAGKLRRFGVSCDDVETLRACLPMPGLSLLELPPEVLDAAGREGLADTIAARGIAVLAREIIRGRPGQHPEAAIRDCLGSGLVTSVIVGTTRVDHLADAVRAAA